MKNKAILLRFKGLFCLVSLILCQRVISMDVVVAIVVVFAAGVVVVVVDVLVVVHFLPNGVGRRGEVHLVHQVRSC